MPNEKITLEYNKPKCKIYYYQSINTIVLEWFGHVSHEEFVEACDFLLELLIKYKSSKMIANNLKSEVVSSKNQDWLDKVWFSKAYKHGYRTSAIVTSKSIFNQVTVKQIVDKMDKEKYKVQFFTNLQDAIEWIKTV
ncbi:hypothetical protein Fleli_3151 [Bernardetia litoralis DSM 6794]|uniref:STAS/SEC14 domain-containing protein n=1 Tax=Bernardetia litoralis (strain ATCC 23117 / DSM 6794 / NBRC 15988 / NCIMB 1366 / Fx l1 / Sio-4) TaxID=880071 RepID=I4ANF2_BERLS|nr:STAS/SEC14 domain-containing protein [Bernardetia litoralis]AFM05487.1 hypothetical protein Fleli_3151 [Bernardetia litoralis DSM 6794]